MHYYQIFFKFLEKTCSNIYIHSYEQLFSIDFGPLRYRFREDNVKYFNLLSCIFHQKYLGLEEATSPS